MTYPPQDPYQQQPQYPPAVPGYQQPPAGWAPPPPPAKKRTGPLVWILGAVGVVLVLCVGFSLIGALTGGSKDTPASIIKTSETPQPVDSMEAVQGLDMGAGEPGAFCATSRLGKYFTKDGVRYTCKGPKPYRWRRD